MVIDQKTVAKSFGWKLLERFSIQGISFVVTIIVARILLPSDYGMVALIMVFLNIANVLIDGGLNTALIQKQDADETDFSTIFHCSIIVSTLLYLVIFLLAPALSRFYNQPMLTSVIRVISLNLFFYAINSIQRAYIAKHMLFNKLFYGSFMSVAISGVVGIAGALSGLGVWALVWQNLTSAVLLAISMFWIIDWRPKWVFSLEQFKKLFFFGWKILLTNMLISVFVNVRGLLIGKYYSPSMLAFFDRGKQLPELLMQNINSSLQTVLFPALASAQHEHNRLKNMVRRSVKTSCLFIFPLMITLIVVAKPIVIILLTEKWIDAVPFVQIFAISYLLMPMQLANIEAIKSIGKSDITLKLECIKKIPDIIILCISVMLGVKAIAWGTVLYNLICLWINLRPNRTLLDYSLLEQLQDFMPLLIIATIAGAIAWPIQYLYSNPFLLIVSQTIIILSVYTIVCLISKNEAILYVRNAVEHTLHHHHNQ